MSLSSAMEKQVPPPRSTRRRSGPRTKRPSAGSPAVLNRDAKRRPSVRAGAASRLPALRRSRSPTTSASGGTPVYRRNIENYMGTLKVPVGIVGPLPVNGRCAEGDYMVPLATTEAALIASYNRGAKLLTCSGGCTARVLDQGVSRAPGFVFASAREALEFAGWVESQAEAIRQAAEATTRYGRLTRMTCIPEGNYAFLELQFDHAGRVRPEHGDDRRPGRLRLHPHPQPHPAAVHLRRVQLLRGQESQPADAAFGARAQGFRRSGDTGSRHPNGSAHHPRGDGALLPHGRRRLLHGRHLRHPGPFRQRPGRSLPGLRPGRAPAWPNRPSATRVSRSCPAAIGAGVLCPSYQVNLSNT
ncbi:MAG: hypothetical protein MZV70_03710 [Desulfobacterales bacterium]|nr:hypothetical protein [Desulfobacterales bacterium]